MTKKRAFDVEQFKLRLTELQEVMEVITEDAASLSLDLPVNVCEEIQRLFALITRDSSQAAVRLYTNIRTARVNEEIKGDHHEER